MDDKKRLKMAIIAGAAEAFKYKEKNWKATEEEVLQHITDNVQAILGNIDDPFD